MTRLEKARKIEKLNPKFYQTLSYILPGSGQILLGDVKESFNSLLLNGGLAVLFIHTANRLSFFDAVLSVVPWFYRYYAGGAKLTRTLALEKKDKRHRQNLAEIVQAVLLGVDKARRDNMPCRINRIRTFDSLFGNRDNTPVPDSDIPDRVKLGLRIHDATIEDHYVVTLFSIAVRARGDYYTADCNKKPLVLHQLKLQ